MPRKPFVCVRFVVHGRVMKILLRLCVLGLLALLGFAVYSFWVYRSPSVAADSSVFIDRGTGGRAMLQQLHQEKLLPAPWKIALPIALSGEYREFKAGEYKFVAGLSPQQVIASIVAGDVIVHGITIPEGWNVAQVRAALLKEPLLEGDLPAAIAEGSLATDTVHFERGEQRANIIKRLQDQQDAILQEAWSKRADGLPIATPQEALVLASIVEEETGVDEERRRVAAVYINRLRIGMPLQADPTVAYGVAPEGMTRPLSRRDLKRDTPYNTYIHPGLPPGPICNPGKASIEAALHPLATDELYFVATGNGGHWFAKSDAEHQRNVAKYRAVRRSQR